MYRGVYEVFEQWSVARGGAWSVLLKRLLPSRFAAVCMTFKQNQAHIRTLRPRMPKKREYTPAERAGMAALAKHLPLRAVADEYQCAPSTVSYQLQKIAKSTAIDPESTVDQALLNKKRSGRPRTYSIREERAVVRTIELHHKVKPKNLPPIVEAHVRRFGLSTIRRIMRENGLERFQALPKPFLTAVHRRKRLAYVKKALLVNPQSLICTDETHLRLGYYQRPWITCRRSERHRKRNLIPAFKKQEGFQVWAAMWIGGHSELTRIDCSESEGENGGVTAKIYIDQILTGPLRRVWRKQKRAWQRYEGGPVILEDNAPIHTAKISKAAKKKEGFKILEHPPNSPDLNPIEYAWSYLKGLLDAHPVRPRNLDEKWELAQLLWNEIPQGYFDNYIWGWPARLEKVRKARGDHPEEYM